MGKRQGAQESSVCANNQACETKTGASPHTSALFRTWGRQVGGSHWGRGPTAAMGIGTLATSDDNGRPLPVLPPARVRWWCGPRHGVAAAQALCARVGPHVATSPGTSPVGRVRSETATRAKDQLPWDDWVHRFAGAGHNPNMCLRTTGHCTPPVKATPLSKPQRA